MKKQVQRHEVEAYLGDFVREYDVDGIIRHGSEVGPDGNRYWKEEYMDEDEFKHLVWLYELDPVVDARKEWEEHGEGWYEVTYSDGPAYGDRRYWVDALDGMYDLILSAMQEATETHIPGVEWLGCRTYTVTVCNGKTEFVTETFDELEDAQRRFDELKGTFPFNDSDEMWLLQNFDNGTQVSLDGYDGE